MAQFASCRLSINIEALRAKQKEIDALNLLLREVDTAGAIEAAIEWTLYGYVHLPAEP